VILLDESHLLLCWPKSAQILRKIFNVAENLIKNWDDFNTEFAESVTLRNKAMSIPMMYLHGSSVMTLTWSGTSITQWLGPTPRRYDVKRLEHVVFICMYLYSCIVTYIHINTDIQTHTWIHAQICTPIHSYVHKHKCVYEYIYTGIYTHLCMYTCLNIYGLF